MSGEMSSMLPAMLNNFFLLCVSLILQFMDLRTRYTALVTLMTHYVKFASETLKRTEEEEVRHCYYLLYLHMRLLGLFGC